MSAPSQPIITKHTNYVHKLPNLKHTLSRYLEEKNLFKTAQNICLRKKKLAKKCTISCQK